MRPKAQTPRRADAPRRTVSITLNSVVYEEARELEINVSRIAEAALAAEVSRLQTARALEEARRDLAAVDAYTARHGSFGDLVREHYERNPEDGT